MKISELRDRLLAIMDEHGDVDVVATAGRMDTGTEPVIELEIRDDGKVEIVAYDNSEEALKECRQRMGIE